MVSLTKKNVISKLESDMDMFEDWYKARTGKIREQMHANTVGISMIMNLQKELSNVRNPLQFVSVFSKMNCSISLPTFQRTTGKIYVQR